MISGLTIRRTAVPGQPFDRVRLEWNALPKQAEFKPLPVIVTAFADLPDSARRNIRGVCGLPVELSNLDA